MSTATQRQARIGLAAALLALPLLIVAAATAIMLVAGPALDATVVTHWGSEGADGWGPAWTYPVLVTSLGFGLPLLAWLFSLAIPRVGDAAVLVAAIVLGTAVTLDVDLTWSFVQQPEAASIGLPITVGALLGLAVGVGAWFLLPREPLPAERREDAAALDLAEGERAVWTGSVGSPVGILLVAGFALVLTIAVAVVVISVAGWAAWPSLITVLVLLAACTTLWWRVTAGPSGLVVRSVLGWPAFRIRSGEIEEARAARVEAFGEFGGWGLRWAPGGAGRRSRFGVIVRSGEALEVRRRDGRIFVVTVEDASTAAAVLNAQRGA